MRFRYREVGLFGARVTWGAGLVSIVFRSLHHSRSLKKRNSTPTGKRSHLPQNKLGIARGHLGVLKPAAIPGLRGSEALKTPHSNVALDISSVTMASVQQTALLCVWPGILPRGTTLDLLIASPDKRQLDELTLGLQAFFRTADIDVISMWHHFAVSLLPYSTHSTALPQLECSL